MKYALKYKAGNDRIVKEQKNSAYASLCPIWANTFLYRPCRKESTCFLDFHSHTMQHLQPKVFSILGIINLRMKYEAGECGGNVSVHYKSSKIQRQRLKAIKFEPLFAKLYPSYNSVELNGC